MSSQKPRIKRPDLIGRKVSAMPRFLAGMLAMPPFLMLDHLPSKAVLFVLFVIAAVLAGKRIRWIYFLILGFSICFFHLLAPFGRVLFEFGPMTITAGALENGGMRALTLMGMVFLSLAAVRPELKLPGRLGGLLGRTFYYFESVIDGKAGLTRKNFFESLDRLLLERFDPRKENFGHSTDGESSAGEPALQPFRSFQGWVLAISFVLIPWSLWILSILGKTWI